MLCRNPYNSGGALFGCGQCTPCRLNKRRVWTHRCILEATQHAQSTFVTLTYEQEKLPSLPFRSGIMSTLQRKDVVGFLKRLRTRVAPLKFRFFGCGEYGEETFRPHYHLLLFGLPTCARGRTGLGLLKHPQAWRDCCASCRVIGETWGYGTIFQGSFTRDSAQYVAGYTVKKMTTAEDSRLQGRHPEFPMMSLRPGIGAWAMEDVALTLIQHNLVAKQPDVPAALMHGKRALPLGRYLRRKLREAVGKEPNAPQETIDQITQELHPLREAAFNASTSFKKLVVETFKPKNDSLDARLAIHERKKPL